MSEQIDRRLFNNVSLASVLALLAASKSTASFAASEDAKSSRRDVIKQTLPGDPPREITLVEVNYPPGTGSPAHQHANGVMAFVVSGSIASKVGDAPEQTYRAGEAWWEPVGANPSRLGKCEHDRAGHLARNLHRADRCHGGTADEANVSATRKGLSHSLAGIVKAVPALFIVRVGPGLSLPDWGRLEHAPVYIHELWYFSSVNNLTGHILCYYVELSRLVVYLSRNVEHYPREDAPWPDPACARNWQAAQ
jgi:quercetin dioxygenase-like cupin family protein